MMTARRVLIADDHMVWRRGLRDVLEPSFEVVAEAGNGDEAVERAIESHPDVVVLDVSMPVKDGISAAHEIRERLPETRVVMVSVSDAEEEIQRAVMAGVNGYVLKDETPETILEAVEQVANGKGYLPPRIAKRVLDSASRVMGRGLLPGRGSAAGLSHREVEVLRLMAEGKTHKQIANQLHISERTVGSHISSIYNKLGTDDRAQALVFAVKHGIIQV
jgi:DNA-binding NarL/FixJ family response regulator